jgi:hypothetical protein
MSASTCAAGVPGATPGESAADVVGDGDAGLADADGVGWAARRLAGADDRFTVADGGTLATAARKGRPAHGPAVAEAAVAEAAVAEAAVAEPDAEVPAEPPDADAQVAAVGSAVTRPAAGRGAGLEAWAR